MQQSVLLFLSRPARLLASLIALFALLQLTGCATSYVDTALSDVPAEKMKKVANPKPVQLLFEFQTKGATNPRATEYLKERVAEIVRNTGLFSQVGTAPVSDSSVVSIVVNNVPLTEDAASKGFVTGLTFGLAGSAVTDGYICNVDYLPGSGKPKISSTVRHAIHTTLGAKGAPVNAKPANSVDDAVNTMLRQIVSNGLNEVASDPSFR